MGTDRKFNQGDVVFHKSNPHQLLVVINGEGSLISTGTVKCRWITRKFKVKTGEFYPFELIFNEPHKNIT